MGAEGAVNIVMRKQIEASDDPDATRAELVAAYRKIIDPYIAAGNAMIDDIIDPRETRQVVARALEMAAGKKVERPWKKHGVMPV
jgi:acetyl-CoA carboxylase carboxyltransferase component